MHRSTELLTSHALGTGVDWRVQRYAITKYHRERGQAKSLLSV